MTLGDKLSRLRKQHNYTQEQLADIVGVSRQSISKWESDAAYPETDKLIVLSKLFHCTVDYLLNDDMDESAPSATEQANKGKALGMGVLNYAPSVLFLVWALSLWAMFAINTVKGGEIPICTTLWQVTFGWICAPRCVCCCVLRA